MSPYPKDGGGASPRIANAISRISDRIAGAGVTVDEMKKVQID